MDHVIKLIMKPISRAVFLAGAFISSSLSAQTTTHTSQLEVTIGIMGAVSASCTKAVNFGVLRLQHDVLGGIELPASGVIRLGPNGLELNGATGISEVHPGHLGECTVLGVPENRTSFDFTFRANSSFPFDLAGQNGASGLRMPDSPVSGIQVIDLFSIGDGGERSLGDPDFIAYTEGDRFPFTYKIGGTLVLPTNFVQENMGGYGGTIEVVLEDNL
ncbi:hypothetical protein [Pseudohaliea rubra]|uniref:hypothetical protein n=1 Tax=Pseudohaliea rubra TaxID=475795 RepID=UPI0011849028|nr:hypothetical protein [Pseudohaliea rubra]